MSSDVKVEDRQQPLRYNQLSSLSDEVLMTQLQMGYPDALAVLFDRYHRLVLNIALRILRDVGEAEDLMQTVFLEILRAAAQFNASKGTAKVWILQYAYHRSFNRRQYLSLRGMYERPEDRKPPFVTENKMSLGTLESARALQQAFGCLSKLQKKTLELAFYEGLTMHEIAQITGESFDSVRHHYYRGLDKLRSILCEACEPHERKSEGEGVAHAQS